MLAFPTERFLELLIASLVHMSQAKYTRALVLKFTAGFEFSGPVLICQKSVFNLRQKIL